MTVTTGNLMEPNKIFVLRDISDTSVLKKRRRLIQKMIQEAESQRKESNEQVDEEPSVVKAIMELLSNIQEKLEGDDDTNQQTLKDYYEILREINESQTNQSGKDIYQSLGFKEGKNKTKETDETVELADSEDCGPQGTKEQDLSNNVKGDLKREDENYHDETVREIIENNRVNLSSNKCYQLSEDQYFMEETIGNSRKEILTSLDRHHEDSEPEIQEERALANQLPGAPEVKCGGNISILFLPSEFLIEMNHSQQG